MATDSCKSNSSLVTRPAFWLCHAALIAGLGACTKKKADAPAKKPVAATNKADSCMRAFSLQGSERSASLNARTFVAKGSVVTEQPAKQDGRVVLGLLANTKEATEQNLKNIDLFLAFFKEQNAEAIFFLGDVAESQKDLEKILAHVAQAHLPVFVLQGNREDRKVFSEGIKAVQKTHPWVFNMTDRRLVKLNDVAVLTVPGYHDKAYLHSKNGCLYTAADLDNAAAALKALEGRPLVVAGHGPPRQAGEKALDRTLEQDNVGDPALAAFLKKHKINFGVFSNIHEAGGKGTNLSGDQVIEPETGAESLYLNIGAADSVSWKMDDGSRSLGMAAVMTIKGNIAHYKFKSLVDAPEKPEPAKAEEAKSK